MYPHIGRCLARSVPQVASPANCDSRSSPRALHPPHHTAPLGHAGCSRQVGPRGCQLVGECQTGHPIFIPPSYSGHPVSTCHPVRLQAVVYHLLYNPYTGCCHIIMPSCKTSANKTRCSTSSHISVLDPHLCPYHASIIIMSHSDPRSRGALQPVPPPDQAQLTRYTNI